MQGQRGAGCVTRHGLAEGEGSCWLAASINYIPIRQAGNAPTSSTLLLCHSAQEQDRAEQS